MTDVTRILNTIEQGDAKAVDELLPLVYEELRRLAPHLIVNGYLQYATQRNNQCQTAFFCYRDCGEKILSGSGKFVLN